MMRAVLVISALLWACTDGNPDSGYGAGGEGGTGGQGGSAGIGGGGSGGSAGEGGEGGIGGEMVPDAAPVDAAPVDAATDPNWTADGRWIGWPDIPPGSYFDPMLCHERCGCASATFGVPGAVDDPYEMQAGAIEDFAIQARFGTCGPVVGMRVFVQIDHEASGADTAEITVTPTDERGASVLTIQAGEPTTFRLHLNIDHTEIRWWHDIAIVPATR